jgi:acyl carrier protein
MPQTNAHRARKELVKIVSYYDRNVVSESAIENSDEFVAFLKKELLSENLDSLDVMDITTELENVLEIDIPEENYPTWQAYFDMLVKRMGGN